MEWHSYCVAGARCRQATGCRWSAALLAVHLRRPQKGWQAPDCLHASH